MKPLLRIFLCLICLLAAGCAQQAMQRQVLQSRTVVLDIGHYYVPGRGGQGARTPDASQGGVIEECEFWYRYAIHVKREIEAAGYTCLICNRGATPDDPALAECAREAGVHQVNTPIPTAIYRSRHHPIRMAVGMLSADYALDQRPAAVVFLHHNSDSDSWRTSNKSAFYCNEVGQPLAQTMARVIDRDVFARGMNNNGVPCKTIIRNNGRLGGGDWLNTCNESYVPAVLTEVAFLNNPDHARFLNNPKNAALFARAIGRGVVEYLRSRARTAD